MDFIKETDDAYLISIRLQPKASCDEVVGVTAEDNNGSHLKIRLTSPPVDGKANEALLKFLSKLLKVPKSKLEITKGLKSRSKTVKVCKDLNPQIKKLTG